MDLKELEEKDRRLLLTNLREDIKASKNTQWQVVNYGVLLNVGLISIINFFENKIACKGLFALTACAIGVALLAGFLLAVVEHDINRKRNKALAVVGELTDAYKNHTKAIQSNHPLLWDIVLLSIFGVAIIGSAWIAVWVLWSKLSQH